MVIMTTSRLANLHPMREIFENRNLLRRMFRRDIETRYQGSIFGIMWAVATPLLLLAAYWLVIGRLLGAKWGVDGAGYPLNLFAGLILHIFFAEVVGRSPDLILENGTYVKKVVFPLGILSMMAVLTALFHLLISVLLLLAGQIVWGEGVPLTWIHVPVVIFPLLPMTLGVSWFVSSLAVYVRDVRQVVALGLTLLMFLSPIFYPLDLIDETLRDWFYLNPLTLPIEQFRQVALNGTPPDWVALGIYSGIALLVALLGGLWFQKTKSGFPDVI